MAGCCCRVLLRRGIRPSLSYCLNMMLTLTWEIKIADRYCYKLPRMGRMLLSSCYSRDKYGWQ